MPDFDADRDEVNALEADDMASLSVALRLLRSIVRR